MPRSRKDEFIARGDLNYVPREKATPIELEPGQFIIFHKNLLHHSATNLSLNKRIGLVIRYTVPGVKVNHEGIFPDHQNFPLLSLQSRVKIL